MSLQGSRKRLRTVLLFCFRCGYVWELRRQHDELRQFFSRLQNERLVYGNADQSSSQRIAPTLQDFAMKSSQLWVGTFAVEIIQVEDRYLVDQSVSAAFDVDERTLEPSGIVLVIHAAHDCTARFSILGCHCDMVRGRFPQLAMMRRTEARQLTTRSSTRRWTTPSPPASNFDSPRPHFGASKVHSRLNSPCCSV